MAPVTFDARSRSPVQPYAFSPWQGNVEDTPAAGSEKILRGEFFCMPFGKGAAPGGEEHPAHGATSSEAWTFVASRRGGGLATLQLAMELPVRRGRVLRSFLLRDGHDAVYTLAQIEGFAGSATFGHHAMIALPNAERGLLLSTGSLRFGMTAPEDDSRRRPATTVRSLMDAAFGAWAECLLCFAMRSRRTALRFRAGSATPICCRSAKRP